MATTVDMKLLRQTKFPPEFNQKVDMKKVNLEVMKKWIAGKISEILGSEDDVVIELCFNLLEGSRFPEIKKLQISLTGFLDKDTPKFCKELWNLCLSAQSNPQGVPKELLEAKKLELIQDKIEAEKAAERARHDREQEMNKQREMDTIRQRERGDRRGRGDGRRDGRGGRGFGHQGGRDSRSPPRRRRSPMRGEGRKGPMRRDVDTYIPRGGGARRVEDDRRRGDHSTPLRSVSRSISRSLTPPRRQQREGRESPRRKRSFSRSLSRSSSSNRRRRSRNDTTRGGRGRGPYRGDHRRRPLSSSSASSSRSPRRPGKRLPSRSLSRSLTPPRRRKDVRRRSPSRSPSRSLSSSPDRRQPRYDRTNRTRGSPSQISRRDSYKPRADGHKGPRNEGRQRSPSRDRFRKREEGRLSRSPSRSRSPQQAKRKRRSLERYEPAGRRRRTSSSVSSASERPGKRADSSGDEASRHVSNRREGLPSRIPHSEGDLETTGKEKKSPSKTESELREALLRQRVKSLRRSTDQAADD